MTIIGAKFKDTVRIPGPRPTEELSARTSKGLALEQVGGVLVVSRTVGNQLQSVAVPLSNVAYLELEPVTAEDEAPPAKAKK